MEDKESIAQAADILRRGGLLAIPTETVYGLGADGLDETAVLHIFEAKGRPQDNPLILHIPDASWLTSYCEDVPDAAYKLAERFWPGPLTMILKKKPCVPLRTTGGLETVGMRCPDHAVTRAIIEASGVPVAAPSANTSGRPQDNPLILHIPDASWLTSYCEDVPDAAYKLAERFWPGPLTMILKKKPCVPLRTTGGLETVGMRCPDHAVTRAIIEASGVPVAAPSANTSGRPSCTTAEHVREDMWGKIDGIVDGGPCQVGVESTIIDLTVTPPQLLRPGGLPLESLRDALGEVTVDKAVTQKMNDGEKPRAPGMKYRHYAPKAPVTVVTGGAKASARYLLTHAGEKSGIICFDEFARLFDGHIVHPLGASDDKRAQAQHVFDALRTFDETNVGEIWAQCPDSKGLGLAIGNRLKKAAGFHVEDADDGKIVIGITGGTGAGKTSLLRALERKGACVLDCDAVYHEMLKDDEPLLRALREAFGDVIFRQDGSVDIHAIGLIVFKDRKKLAELDAIVHEHIPRALAQKMAATNAEIIGLDAIKLIESGLGAICDATVAVTAPEEVRVKRIMARDSITEEYARSRIAAQKDADYFRAQCDYEFVNDLPTAEKAEHAAEVYINTIINNLKEETER